MILTEDTDSFIVGDRVWVRGTKPGRIAFIGETHFSPGDWAGIVLDEPIGESLSSFVIYIIGVILKLNHFLDLYLSHYCCVKSMMKFGTEVIGRIEKENMQMSGLHRLGHKRL